jgi:type II restriction enzyme
VKCFYSTKYSKLSDLSDELTKNNPLNFDLNHNHGFYEYKLKKFLTDVAVGMMPSKVWNGVYDATGGYLIVKENGEVLAYHLFNRNEFEDYLFLNTKLETASTTRHDFGKVYLKDNDCFINLNLQIRFIK